MKKILTEVLVNFFCKGPENKYFRLCRPLKTTHNSALQSSMKAAAGNTQMNDVAMFQ